MEGLSCNLTCVLCGEIASYALGYDSVERSVFFNFQFSTYFHVIMPKVMIHCKLAALFARMEKIDMLELRLLWW